ncbi:MAG: polysaccharide pyruvyl transferase family protein [Colwellia sp.]|nr:polysaccharide pyruvyl transferase family protein [Colwellia sp.]MCW8864954.1 polysaccharide pyruvyl transferase family protein [Colwellia sp.]MCW9082877.1 polysaccharide pyruvyl transferase family protein [Colwellia sp.]
MRKIFIVNAQPGGNKGAEAMLETVVHKVNEITGNIYIETLDDRDVYDQFIQRMGGSIDKTRFRPKNILSPYDVDVSAEDIVIDIGGINYHDKSLKANIRNFIRHSYFLRKKAKLIFFTQDFGPARKLITKTMVNIVYRQASAIFMRSEQSKAFLEKVIGEKETILGPYPDCTLILDAVDFNGFDKLPENYFVLAPSAIMYNQYGEEYIDEFVNTAEKLSVHSTPLILVHNFTSNGASSDFGICKKLHEKILAKSIECYFVSEDRKPSELKSILKGAKFSITSRYHVLVGSMSSGTPSFAIGWSHKYKEFMSLYNLEVNIVKFESDFSQEIIDKALAVMDNADQKEKILEINTSLKNRIQCSFSKLIKYLN